jgi:SAM-dependent methyltransferase
VSAEGQPASAGERPSFTAHNVLLADGTRTIPEWGLLTEDPYTQAVLRTLDLFCPTGDGPAPRVADLGCLEGGFAFAMADVGYDVLGVEARQGNVDKCLWALERRHPSTIGFVQDDVRNIAEHGTFDAVFAAGILYHLDKPIEFLNTLGRITRKLLIVQTHYAPPLGGEGKLRLSAPVLNEGALGRWFGEWSKKATPEEIEAKIWTSVGNARSFWLDKKHLLQAISNAGFPVVFEQYDFLGDIVANDYIERNHRGLFVGVKPSSRP